MTEALDFQIIGEDLQAIIVKLNPDQGVIAEPGSMMYMDEYIELETKLDDRENTGLIDQLFTAGKRLLVGENLFITVFENKNNVKQEVAFAAPYPGKIIHINLSQFKDEIICQRHSFLCASRGLDISIAFNQKIGVGLFGGEGFIMQRLKGDGEVFLHAGGTIHSIDLVAGQVLKVDTGCIVAMENSINYDIQFVKGVKNMFFGGEGLFYAVLRGPGKVFLQTIPFSRLADRILASAHGSTRQGSAGSVEEGSILGGFGRLFQ